MTNERQRNPDATRSLSREEYERECLMRNPEFRRRWDPYWRELSRGPLKGEESEWLEAHGRFIKQTLPTYQEQPEIILHLPMDATKSQVVSEFRTQRRRLLRYFPQPKRRTHNRELAFRLQVFDHYAELRNFTQVARRLGTSESNVRRPYNEAFRDIFSAAPPKRAKERRAAGFDAASHITGCPTCQRALNRKELNTKELCPAARAFVEQDQRALVGTLTATGTPEVKVVKGRVTAARTSQTDLNE